MVTDFNWMVVICLQNIQTSNHYVVHLKLIYDVMSIIFQFLKNFMDRNPCFIILSQSIFLDRETSMFLQLQLTRKKQ